MTKTELVCQPRFCFIGLCCIHIYIWSCFWLKIYCCNVIVTLQAWQLISVGMKAPDLVISQINKSSLYQFPQIHKQEFTIKKKKTDCFLHWEESVCLAVIYHMSRIILSNKMAFVSKTWTVCRPPVCLHEIPFWLRASAILPQCVWTPVIFCYVFIIYYRVHYLLLMCACVAAFLYVRFTCYHIGFVIHCKNKHSPANILHTVLFTLPFCLQNRP